MQNRNSSHLNQNHGVAETPIRRLHTASDTDVRTAANHDLADLAAKAVKTGKNRAEFLAGLAPEDRGLAAMYFGRAFRSSMCPPIEHAITQPPSVAWRLRSGERVIDRQRSHIHLEVEPLLAEVFAKIDSQKRSFFTETIEFAYNIGEMTCVETSDGDEIVFAQRQNRKGLTRFVKNRQPEPTPAVTTILKETGIGEYVLITAWAGTQAQPEPWDPRATNESVLFWSRHALIWGSEIILPGTEATRCAWM